MLAPTDDEDLEQLVLARSPRFRALLDQSRQSLEQGKGLKSADFWKAAAKRKRAP